MSGIILADGNSIRGVFISYSSADKSVADAVCGRMESQGLNCWIAPRDVGPGRDYAEAIMEGIRECSVLVLVFSRHADSSTQVLREIERAVHFGKVVVPFRIEDCKPTKSLEYFLSVPHWFDAFPDPVNNYLDSLVGVLRRAMANAPATSAAPIAPVGPQPITYTPALLAGWEKRLDEGTITETFDCRNQLLMHDLRELLHHTLAAHDIDDHYIASCEVALVELYRNVARHAAGPVANVEIALSIKFKRFFLSVSSQGAEFSLESALSKYENVPAEERTIHGLQNLLARGTLELAHNRGWNTVTFSTRLGTRSTSVTEHVDLHLLPSVVKVGNREFGYQEWSHLAGSAVIDLLRGQWKAGGPCQLSVLYKPPDWTKDSLEISVMNAFKRFVTSLRTNAAFTLKADPSVYSDPQLMDSTLALVEDEG